MLMVVDFSVMSRMFMLMGAVLTGVLMIMHVDVPPVGMRVGMLMHVFMLVNVSVLVAMNQISMAMLMRVHVLVLMVMEMPVLVGSFHYRLLPS
ncbi:MAG: hypothetical protein ACLFUU_13795 [Desulfobacteraceae bacterium]